MLNTQVAKTTQDVYIMTDEEWLNKCRFYRSGSDKMVEQPNGGKCILRPESTEKNFRKKSRDFLLSLKKIHESEQKQKYAPQIKILTQNTIAKTGKICFTGKMPEVRTFYQGIAEKAGYTNSNNVTEDLDLLVCMDINSNSGKIQKARKSGIRIQPLDEWLKDVKQYISEPPEPIQKKQNQESVKEQENFPDDQNENFSDDDFAIVNGEISGTINESETKEENQAEKTLECRFFENTVFAARNFKNFPALESAIKKLNRKNEFSETLYNYAHKETKKIINGLLPCHTPRIILNRKKVDEKDFLMQFCAKQNDYCSPDLEYIYHDAENKKLVSTNKKILAFCDMPESESETIQKSFLEKSPDYVEQKYPDWKKVVPSSFTRNKTIHNINIHVGLLKSLCNFLHIFKINTKETKCCIGQSSFNPEYLYKIFTSFHKIGCKEITLKDNGTYSPMLFESPECTLKILVMPFLDEYRPHGIDLLKRAEEIAELDTGKYLKINFFDNALTILPDHPFLGNDSIEKTYEMDQETEQKVITYVRDDYSKNISGVFWCAMNEKNICEDKNRKFWFDKVTKKPLYTTAIPSRLEELHNEFRNLLKGIKTNQDSINSCAALLVWMEKMNNYISEFKTNEKEYFKIEILVKNVVSILRKTEKKHLIKEMIPADFISRFAAEYSPEDDTAICSGTVQDENKAILPPTQGMESCNENTENNKEPQPIRHETVIHTEQSGNTTLQTEQTQVIDKLDMLKTGCILSMNIAGCSKNPVSCASYRQVTDKLQIGLHTVEWTSYDKKKRRLLFQSFMRTQQSKGCCRDDTGWLMQASVGADQCRKSGTATSSISGIQQTESHSLFMSG